MNSKTLLSLLAVTALIGGAAYYLIETRHDHADGHDHDHDDEHGHEHAMEPVQMQTTIDAGAAERAGIVVEPAGPATMTERLAVYGRVELNADRIARAIPRFGGVVREARKALGDSVTAGDVVAVVESNQTLAALDVKAPISGVIVARDAMAGETVVDGAVLYTIADLSEVWIDLNVPKREQARVRTGQTVMIQPDDGGPEVRGVVSWLSPFTSAEAQTIIARVLVDNPDGRWRPGLFVKAGIIVSEESVPVAVKESGLQTLVDATVVFSRHGDIYQARPVQIGRRSGGFAEVLGGLQAGEPYVSGNSFLIKADIGKSGAAHDH